MKNRLDGSRDDTAAAGDAKPSAFPEISARIREMREICGYSAEQMAVELGVDIALYEKYETCGENIPISALYHMARLFKVDMSEILTGRAPRINTYCVVPSGQGAKTERYPGYHFRRLAHTFMHKIMEPMIVAVDPSESDPGLVTHPGQEFNYVLEGRLLISVGGHESELGPGDCVYYDSTEPHGMKALGGKNARFLAFVL